MAIFHDEVAGKPKPFSRAINSLTKGVAEGNKYFQEKKLAETLQRIGVDPGLAEIAQSRPEILEKFVGGYISKQNEAAKQKAYDERANQILRKNPEESQPNEGGISSQAPQGKQPQGLQAATDEQLIALSGVKGYAEPAKQEIKNRQEGRKINQKKEEGKIKRHTDLSQKVLERADQIAEEIPKKESSLGLMKDAIVNKDLSFWTKDNLAELTGIEGFRSPEGAIFKTAAKEYFLGNIARAGARPNQWIEQQIQDMMTKIGRSTEANLSVTRALENELLLDKERINLTEKISNQLEEEYGYIPRDLGNRVTKELSKFAEEKQQELYNDLRAIKAIGEKKSQPLSKVKPGTPVSKYVVQALLLDNGNDKEKARSQAKKLGYEF